MANRAAPNPSPHFVPSLGRKHTRARGGDERMRRHAAALNGGDAREAPRLRARPPEGERAAIEWLHGGALRR
jgi:hypothetical protein